MKKLLLITSFILSAFGMAYGHKFAQTKNLQQYYSTYFGVERCTPTGFTIDSVAGIVWQPFFQMKEYTGLQMNNALIGMPVISEIYRSNDNQCVLMENNMQCDVTDSAFNKKLSQEIKTMLRIDVSKPLPDALKSAQFYCGKDARRLLNADTVIIVNYTLDRPEIYNAECKDMGKDFAYCTAIYAKRTGYAGHIGYLLMTKEGFANRDKYINIHNSSVRYIDGWESSDSIEASRNDIWWSYIQKDKSDGKNLKPIVK